MGRFTGVDPISDQFPWVSTYNYAENEPVANIDLHGLQKVRYDKNALGNSTFQSARAINLQTTGGQRFNKTLKSQNKIDVVYAIIPKFYDGETAGPFSSFDDFKKAREKKPGLKAATSENWKEYESYFESNKQVLVISTYCDDTCDNSDIKSAATNLNHEEVAHGINRLNGVEKSVSQEHLDFNGEAGQFSPSDEEISSNPKYRNTKAKKQIDEINEIMGDDK